MQCLILNITRSHFWRDGMKKGEATRIPAENVPTMVHDSVAIAEKEAARLACQHGGEFAVFELRAVVKGRVLSDDEKVPGMGPCGARVPKWEDAQEGAI